MQEVWPKLPFTGVKLSQSDGKVSIVLCGEAGQGIQTVERLLTRVFKFAGYHIFATKEYMSRIRGGSNSTEIVVSSKRIQAFLNRIDLLIPLSKGAVQHVEKRLSSKTLILGDSKNLSAEELKNHQVIDVPILELSSKVGGRLFANIIAAGMISRLFQVDQSILNRYLKETFAKKGEEVVEKNIQAAKLGYQIGSDLEQSKKLQFKMGKDPKVASEIILNGAEAVGLGALAGGCNFIAAYPMSPSTPVLVFLSQHIGDFEIIAEQAEDEISAVNMAIGASYAGARAMVTTSGGGFALMVEGVSLAGMLETPIVIHLAQRPGPATGLPTRTEQADLLFVLHAGHGEFPRFIFAPGKLEDAFHLTQLAFNLADKYQVPAFILTDQYLIDSYRNLPSLDIHALSAEKHLVKTSFDYQRYQQTKDGASPRGVPGFGQGVVAVDSDEHDQAGHITEDHDVRVNMVEKRLRKLEQMRKEVVPPELVGDKNYQTLALGWGSTYGAIKESLELLDQPGLAFLHFKQVYPLHPKTASYLKKAKKTIIFENNATSQFGQLIKLETGLEIDKKVLKYNGLPFSVEEITKSLRKELGAAHG